MKINETITLVSTLLGTSENILASECADLLSSQDCLIHYSPGVPASQFTLLFQEKSRFQLEGETEAEVLGYSSLLEALGRIDGHKKIDTLTIIFETGAYKIFFHKNQKKYLGILRSNGENFSSKVKSLSSWKKKGAEVNYYLYSNGLATKI